MKKKSDDQADHLQKRAADLHAPHPKGNLPALVADTMTTMTRMIDLDDHLQEDEEDPHQNGDHQVGDVDR